MKRPWLYYITPFTVAGVAALIPLAAALSYGIVAVFIFALGILLLLGVDYFIKTLTNARILYIWIIEAILLALLFWSVSGSSFRISGC
jgi:hypothetical protein